ncbi:MAG: hypothetical protein V4448_01030 [Pseudomonadota bacterium]
MTKISSAVEAKVRASFSPQDAEIAITALAMMKEPSPTGEWAATRMRVQAAIVISSQCQLDELLIGIANSQLDWRDTLMNGGLAESNWRSVVKNAGFDIPVDN